MPKYIFVPVFFAILSFAQARGAPLLVKGHISTKYTGCESLQPPVQFPDVSNQTLGRHLFENSDDATLKSILKSKKSDGILAEVANLKNKDKVPTKEDIARLMANMDPQAALDLLLPHYLESKVSEQVKGGVKLNKGRHWVALQLNPPSLKKRSLKPADLDIDYELVLCDSMVLKKVEKLSKETALLFNSLTEKAALANKMNCVEHSEPYEFTSKEWSDPAIVNLFEGAILNAAYSMAEHIKITGTKYFRIKETKDLESTGFGIQALICKPRPDGDTSSGTSDVLSVPFNSTAMLAAEAVIQKVKTAQGERLQISGIAERSRFVAIGFENEDILVSIQGESSKVAKDSKLFLEWLARSHGKWKVNILRKGNPFVIKFPK